MNIWLIIIFNIIIFYILYYISSVYSNFEDHLVNEDYLRIIVKNIVLSFCMIIPVLYFSKLTLRIPLLKNIIITFIVEDTLNYWYHFITHSIPVIKKNIHTTHHTYSELLPLDNLFFDSVDHIINNIIYLYTPLLFVDNIVEYLISFFITLFHSFYTHSDISEVFILPGFISAKYHALHHKYGYGNFAGLFPFWDDYMGTRVKEVSKEHIKEDIKDISMSLNKFYEECKKGRHLTIINNDIIDCKSWIDIHPGGSSVIKALIGKDSTEDFNKIHGTCKPAKEMIKKLRIAYLSK
jgi:sterol desaturase/sphingolipid hydroxylase (fatty acid hydroxylase superfamily)